MNTKTAARLLVLSVFVVAQLFAAPRAKNVILFIGDAGGISTLNAASLYAHDKPQSLFIQSMPHFALSDTSALNGYVTDSAAGMTAIVTGRKTNNLMLSVLPDQDGGEGEILKTILEHAEERGLSTGVISNMAIWDATPAACYAHAASRKSTVEIFSQVLKPRFGNGVEVLIGADRIGLYAAMQKIGVNADEALQKAGFETFENPAAITTKTSRVASIYDRGQIGDFAPIPAVDKTLEILSRNKKGYFLMVEWDLHTDNIKRGLDRAIVLDDLIRHVASKVGKDTLILFAADHSFDLRLQGGKPGTPFAQQHAATVDAPPPSRPVLRMENKHTGEEILVAAKGPGAERLHGFIPNTKIFEIMMSAYGWR
ncbi:alkaline phosphatase [Oleiharenicola lentus]|uniref:alkaline phosphatase n=1 Tax=Oleiharenicola lentus TaxID=2508720 RepID=UPI003F6618DC